jgi:hypothetical protein
VTGDLQNELAVPPFIEELIGRQTADWLTTENERLRTETKVLIPLFPFHPHEFNAIDLTMQLLRDPNAAMQILQPVYRFFQSRNSINPRPFVWSISDSPS